VTLRLLRLACPQCGSQIAAEGEDVVYYCVSCRSGFVLDPQAAAGLAPVEVAFVTAPAAAAGRWLPFWALPARITLHEREGSRGLLDGIAALLGGGDGSGAGGTTEGTFAIPAFAAPLAELTALAARYTQALPKLGARPAGRGTDGAPSIDSDTARRSPRLGERLGERLTGGRLTVADAEKLAHFVLIAAEAGKPDTLKDLRYTLAFGPPRLLGVPFVRQGESWVDAHFGLPAAVAAE
jgi:hypothetical protein